MRRVHLGGEGVTELGRPAPFDQTRVTEGEPGLLETVLEKRHDGAFQVSGTTVWKQLRKYRAPRAGDHRDTANVLKLCQRAIDAGAQVVAFSRDADGDDDRVAAIREGIERATAAYPELRIVGATARPCIEAWVLWAVGRRASQGSVKDVVERELGHSSLRQKREALLDATFDRVEHEADTGLGDFVRAAKAALDPS